MLSHQMPSPQSVYPRAESGAKGAPSDRASGSPHLSWLAMAVEGSSVSGTMGVRRALLVASLERYVAVAVNLVTMMIVARLLTPGEIGIAVLGATVLGVAEGARDLGCSGYLIQRSSLTPDRIRTVFTILLITTTLAMISIALMLSTIAGYYRQPEIAAYLSIGLIGFLLGPIASTLAALLRRNLQFNVLAGIAVAAAAVNALTTIGLALLGFGYQSFVWASVCAGFVSVAMFLRHMKDTSLFPPTLKHWREVLNFGRFDTGTDVLNRIWEAAPYFLLGRFVGVDGVGLFQRASTVAALPIRMLLAGIATIAMPFLAEAARSGGCLKTGFLRAVGLVTGVLWPSLTLVALLAHPIISVLLGSQWLASVPLVQLLAIAMMVWFTVDITYPTLVSAGAVRRAFAMNAIFVPAALAVLAVAARYGLHAAAFAMIIAMSIRIGLALYFLRRELGFTLGEVWQAVWRSLALVPMTAAGPLAVIAASGWRLDISIVSAAASTAFAGLGWLVGLKLTKHSLAPELDRILGRVQSLLPALAGR